MPASFQLIARRAAACMSALWLTAGAVNGAPADEAPPPALAEHQIKALYLFNFTKYVDWPADAFASSQAPLVIGIQGAPAVASDVAEIIRGRRAGQREIRVQAVATEAEAAACHILYRPGDAAGARPADARARPVLTVGESDSGRPVGSIITFARRDNNVRLIIDLAAARRARLTISAKLLAVAQVEGGTPAVSRSSP